MSRFFTRKYLRYFGQPDPKATIDRDTFCPECKYNLRGLTEDHRCPECGWDPLTAGIEEPAAPPPSPEAVKRLPLIDAMSMEVGANRQRWKVALTLASLCLVTALIARMFLFGVTVAGLQERYLRSYLVLGLIVSVAWTIATVLLLPRRLGRYWRWVRPMRTFVLATQWLWILAYVIWLIDFTQADAPEGLAVIQIVLRGIAGIGFIVLAVVMRHVAEEAEVDEAARRINAAAWMLPILTPLAMALAAVFTAPAGGLSGGPVGMAQLILLLPPAALILAWCWALGLLGLGFWRLGRHTTWSIRHDEMAVGREERIARKRQWLQRQADAKVRPLPDQSGQAEDLAFIEHNVPCPYCGYNLRGLVMGRVCPECGCDPMENPAFDPSVDFEDQDSP